MTEIRLRWFGHRQRRLIDVPVRKTVSLEVIGVRKSEYLKILFN